MCVNVLRLSGLFFNPYVLGWLIKVDFYELNILKYC